MSNNQYNLFNDLPEEEKTGKKTKEDKNENFNEEKEIRNYSKNLTTLKLSKQDNKKESKQKKLIKSRLEKIEKTKSLLEKDKQTLEKIKQLYHEKLSKELEESSKITLEFLEKLIKRYKQKSFSQSQRRYLEHLIEENIESLDNYDYPYEKYSVLVEEFMMLKEQYFSEMNNPFEDPFEEIFGEDDLEDDDFDEDFKETDFKELEKEMLLNMLRDMGLDVDEEILEGLDLNDPDFQAKFQQRTFEYAHKQKENQAKVEKKNKILATDKEFTKLYKKLAKKIHPDLTTDETERKRRELLMKELSKVWKERDYYELLALQAKIDPDSEDDINLGENQLKQVADDLLNKIRSVEAERFQFKRMPENDFYFSNFYARTDKKIKKFIEEYRLQLIDERKNTKNYISFLKNQKTTKAFLKNVEDELMKNSWEW